IGNRGERTRFHVRYFEIDPGGFSSFECHRHEHVVVVLRGSGEVRLGRSTKKMGFLDIAYIAPDAPHQLRNPTEEPFGFLCIVNARRDRPKPVIVNNKKTLSGKKTQSQQVRSSPKGG